MLVNILDISNERSEYMKSPFGRDFPFGTDRVPGLTANFGQQGFGRTKQRKRFRNGDVRAAVLVLLAEQPMHGYQIIQEIAERTGALWQPSPGSIYPVLQQLEDEGLILIEQTEGRKVANLTEAGRAYVEENWAKLEEVWNALTNNNVDESRQEKRNLFVTLKLIGVAAKQVAKVGTDKQLAEARKVLADTRRRLYLILAEDDSGEEEQDAGHRPSV
jgi:DNA-binding PadR family transcriptional regulator